jgi:hypothetical protein|tara:strand:- start:943 stop:1362 length:420 start_codon:yes stop_codon:yes gene_type:complete
VHKVYRFISETTGEECEVKIKKEFKMKKYTLSLIHLIIVVVTFILSGLLAQERPEMIPYRLVPGDGVYNCRLEFEVEIINPYQVENLVQVHREETIEIIYERIYFEVLHPNYQNEIFKIDDKLYYLIRVPYTGVEWITN